MAGRLGRDAKHKNSERGCVSWLIVCVCALTWTHTGIHRGNVLAGKGTKKKKRERERNPASMARGPFTNSGALYLQRLDSAS